MPVLPPVDPAVAVVIPTLNAAKWLPRQIPLLWAGRLRPRRILVIDSASTDGTAAVARDLGCEVLEIPRREFDHGGTRTRGLHLCEEPVVAFLTQDAVPADPGLLERLIAPLCRGEAGAAYARQIPHHEAWPPEIYARSFNYPPVSAIRRKVDLERGDIRTVFFSNVASAVRRDAFLAVGGFPLRTVMNEDVVLCSRLLAADLGVAYAADAVAHHSHNYSLPQQLRRYFDIGAFHAFQAHHIPSGGTGAAGRRFVVGQLAWLVRSGHAAWIPRTIAETGVKFLGFFLGKRAGRLSPVRRERLAMHRGWWRGLHARGRKAQGRA